MGSFYGFLHCTIVIDISGALIEGHYNVGTKCLLELDRKFWSYDVLATIDMRPETHAIVIDFSQMSQAKYLIAPTVGEDRAGPAHEAMKPSQLFDDFDSGSEIKMIRVT
jgi:hypothetical protein